MVIQNKQEKFEQLKKELIYLVVLLVLIIVMLKVIFNKESFFIVLKLALSLFWLFILPGFMIMYLFIDKLNFIERIIAGTVLGMAFVGVLGYNLGIIGVSMKYQIWVLPLTGIVIGIFALIKKKRISF